MRTLAPLLFLGLVLPLAAAQNPPIPQPTLSAIEAAQHVGENRTVCGEIVNTYTAATSHGTPTFIDLDQAYPHQIFDLVIWGDNKEAVGHFPDKGKVCASGTIVLYRGRPEILLRDWHSWYVPSDTEARASAP
jgi:hypothetical protein